MVAENTDERILGAASYLVVDLQEATFEVGKEIDLITVFLGNEEPDK